MGRGAVEDERGGGVNVCERERRKRERGGGGGLAGLAGVNARGA